MTRIVLTLLGLLVVFTGVSIAASILNGSLYPLPVRHVIFYVMLAVVPIDAFAFAVMLRAYMRSRLDLLGHRTIWTGLILASGVSSGLIGLAGVLGGAQLQGAGAILVLLTVVCPAGVSLLIVLRYFGGA